MTSPSTLDAASLTTLKARLSANEKRVLLALAAAGGEAEPDALVAAGDFQVVAEVMSATNWLADKGLVTVAEATEVRVGLDKEGVHHAEVGLPERRALEALTAAGGRGTMGDLAKVLAKNEVSITLGWLKRKGWADITKVDGDTVLVLKEGADVGPARDEALLAQLAEGEAPEGVLDPKPLAALRGRKGILKEREVTTRTITLAPLGADVVASGLEVREEIVHLDAATLATGRWKEVDIRPYDVHAYAPTRVGGKPHPLVTLIQEIRDIFVEMGFAEIDTNYVESAFWNMDTLFIPQDHPAREMQDTFYLDNPATQHLDDELVSKIAAVHEHGGDTGSTGWGGTFSKETAARGMLRTHTTVGTIRYLTEHPDEPCRVFSIGRVFRKETMDATHLPEFHQVEGIIKEPGANFRNLVGMMREFFRRMGFPDIRLRPAYFPYTEPSMEIEVFYNGKWMELGGSGIFRPEVTEPVGVTDPVCAWGIGLERLAMMRFGLKDIRELYVSDVDWLRQAPLRF